MAVERLPKAFSAGVSFQRLQVFGERSPFWVGRTEMFALLFGTLELRG